MLERFTDRARSVVMLAQEEARLFNHHYVGSEHIVLALLAEGDGVAGRTLASAGLTLQRLRARVEGMVGAGTHPPRGHIPFTPRAKKVLELSLRECLERGGGAIHTGHLLLGLLRLGEGAGVEALRQEGLDLEELKRRVEGAQHEAREEHEEPQALGFKETVEVVIGGGWDEDETSAPRCPRCRQELGALARAVDVREEGSDTTRRVLLVFCAVCDTALGILPSD